MPNAPSRDECLTLINRYRMPHNIRRHTAAVLTLSMALAKKLNDKDMHVDLDVLRAGAMLHDLFKVKDIMDVDDGQLSEHPEEDWAVWRKLKEEQKLPHDEAICQLLLPKYPKVATVIREAGFMNIFVRGFSSMESKILYYADKRVMHDKIVSVLDRLDEGYSRYLRHHNNAISMSLAYEKIKELEDELMQKAGAEQESFNALNAEAQKENLE
ncbi:MAG: HDIG domain-containing metalloprotein [Candidatus Woesearchaeota archaeon]